MAYPSDIDLLLLGKTGNGKSATGNSILGFRAFESKPSSTSVTTSIQTDVGEFHGKVIKVVDGPGVGDTRLTNKESLENIQQCMESAISCNPRGYHAFLLVVRFGGRFTEEDRDTVLFLKKIFGDDFVGKFCILVMTCGDNFEKEAKSNGTTFKKWCNEQRGVFKSLTTECNNRVILFNNITSNEQKKEDQLQKLIHMVEHLGSEGHRYTDNNFEQAKRARQRVMVEENESKIQEEAMVEMRLIMRQFNKLQKCDPEMRIEPLEILHQRTQKLCDELSAKDQSTGVLHKLIETVTSLLRSVVEEQKLCERLIQEKQRMNSQIKEKEKEMEKKLKKQKKQYEKELREKKIAEEEHRRLCRELEATRRQDEKKREEQYKKMISEQEQELKKQQQKYDDLENEFKKVKMENETSILSKIFKTVSFPFRKNVVPTTKPS